MLPRIVAAAALASALAVTAVHAAQMVDSDFQITFQYGGAEQRLSDDKVPLLPGNVCYTWWMQLSEGPTPKAVVERLILPEPLSDWGDLGSDPDDSVEISADRATATSTFAPEIGDDGWFSKGWCAAEGDPTGPHRIEVSVGGVLLRTFDFEVLAPEDYSWPELRQPDPRERSVQHSW